MNISIPVDVVAIGLEHWNERHEHRETKCIYAESGFMQMHSDCRYLLPWMHSPLISINFFCTLSNMDLLYQKNFNILSKRQTMYFKCWIWSFFFSLENLKQCFCSSSISIWFYQIVIYFVFNYEFSQNKNEHFFTSLFIYGVRKIL